MDIAVIGGYGVGQVFRVLRFPDAGESLTATSFEAMHGGKGSNQAVAARRLGADVSLLSAVGSDAWAARAHELWRSEGVDATHVRAGEAATMVGAIIVEDSGENLIVIAPGALGELDDTDAERFRPAIARADLLVISLEIPDTLAIAAVRIAREEGTRVLLNPAPAAHAARSLLADVDYLTPNLTEGAALADISADADPESVVTALRAKTAAAIALTLGGGGVLAVDADGRSRRIPAADTRGVVDTTGAGDSFTAALAVGVCAGASFFDAVAWAAAAGAHTVGAPGVIDALPALADLPALRRP